MILKTLFIVLLIGSISAVHLLYTGSSMSFHVLHQQLFYIPLVLASFWFGIRAGLVTAVAVSFLYGPAMVLRHHEAGMHLTVVTQIALYLVVAFLIGLLSDRHRRQQQELLKNERITALGKAASTLGFEIGDIVRGVESIYKKAGGLKTPEADADFQSEIHRLQTMVDGLGHFTPTPDRFPVARRSSCGRAATTGNGFWRWPMRVRGVVKENEEKLFTAFFTTRPDGYGLSLSSGRKLLRDLGGDLVYRRGKSGISHNYIPLPPDTNRCRLRRPPRRLFSSYRYSCYRPPARCLCRPWRRRPNHPCDRPDETSIDATRAITRIA